VHQPQRRLARQVSRRTVGSRGHRHAKPGVRRWTGARRTCAARPSTSSQVGWRAATAQWWSRTLTWPRCSGAWADGSSAGPSARPASAGSALRSHTNAGRRAAGGGLVVAACWFGSSKSHHYCGGYRANLKLGDRVWSCPRCGRLVDRNANAALNLRDWTGAVDIGKVDADGDVRRGGVAARCRAWPPRGRPTAGRLMHRHERARPWKDHREVAGACDTRTEPAMGEEPRTGVSAGECSQALRSW